MPRHPPYYRLAQAQNDILSAVVGGPASLEIFHQSWTRLSAEFDNQASLDKVDEELTLMAHSTSSIVATLAHSFLELHNTANDRYGHLVDKIEGILDNAGSPVAQAAGHIPSLSFTHAACSWLLESLYDPYPSTTVKEEFAKSFCISVDFVSAWFNTTREQIGWTTLARHYFNGSRSATVDAARRFFVEQDASRPLQPNIEHAFSVVKQNLEDIQSGKYLTLRRVDDVDAEGHTIMGGDGVATFEESVKDTEGWRSSTEEEPITTSSSPRILQLPEWDESEEEEEDMTPPPPIAGCKRRADTDPCIEQTMDIPRQHGTRSLKRQKSDHSVTRNEINQFCLPSRPIASIDWQTLSLANSHTITFDPKNPLTRSSPSPAVNASVLSLAPPMRPASVDVAPTRKRRLSDASDDISPKRPRHIRSGPRMQMASDPLPRGVNNTPETVLFDTWFQAAIDLPSEPIASDVSNETSPATNISSHELPLSPTDFILPSQQVDLSDEAFQAMLASCYDMSANFIPVEQDAFEMLPSLDNLFPSSCDGVSNSFPARPGQSIVDLGSLAECAFQTEGHIQPLNISPSGVPWQHVLYSPLDDETSLTVLDGLCHETIGAMGSEGYMPPAG
uniref:B1 homeodomain mating type protein n=1 Tax=Heterobasidion irregulare TaxID=984962 RepID=S5RVV5_9AGAM|nr:b1 homeodomain mating type protein [Heterobasidion irregulare]